MTSIAPGLGGAILALLPEDGTPVLNRIKRVMLARRLERAIDDDVVYLAIAHQYFASRRVAQWPLLR